MSRGYRRGVLGWKLTLLLCLSLHSQAIDEQVESEQTPCYTPDGGVTLDEGVPDTHAEVSLHTQLLYTTHFTQLK